MISVKEIITSIVVGAISQLLMPTISALALAVVLWILYKHVLPLRKEKKTLIRRKKSSQAAQYS